MESPSAVKGVKRDVTVGVCEVFAFIRNRVMKHIGGIWPACLQNGFPGGISLERNLGHILPMVFARALKRTMPVKNIER